MHIRNFFNLLLGLLAFGISAKTNGQSLVIDTLAIQTFDTLVSSPNWAYTGTPNAFLNGVSPVNATPSNSPVGIDSSWAWHLVSVSGGNPVIFNTIQIPSGYDTIKFSLRLAAMNLFGTTGGPDDLDYVLIEYSLDSGVTYSPRIRLRGAISNNSSWAYDATGIASVYYTPATESVFQPINAGLQTTEGYSFAEIRFPGSIQHLSIRITPRSSSSSDSWLLDNILLTGVSYCSNSTSTISPISCNSYTSPSGNYLWSTSGSYTDTIPNYTGCDSIITINLTINSSTTSIINVSNCNAYTSPSGSSTWTSSGIYTDTIPNHLGCDSVITINLTINTVDTSVTQNGFQLTANATGASFQWINCSTSLPISGETNQNFTPSSDGDYAVIVTENGCTDTSACYTIVGLGIENNAFEYLNVFPNPTTGIVNINTAGGNNPIQLEVINNLGQTIQQQIINTDQYSLMIDEPAGIYFVRVKNEAGDFKTVRISKK